MKFLLVFILSLAFLAGCQSQPDYTDNGNPGQIKAVIYYDDNRSGAMDDDKTGTQTEVDISLDMT